MTTATAAPAAAPAAARAFRDTMGAFATGVTVLTTGPPPDVHAMTANAITSVSLDPMLVLACVGRATAMAARLAAGDGLFVVNVLADDQHRLADWFAGRAVDRPEIRFVPWAGGSRLAGGVAAIACEQEAWHDGGDHRIVVGRVVALHRAVGAGEPLVFFGGAYRRLAGPTAGP